MALLRGLKLRPLHPQHHLLLCLKTTSKKYSKILSSRSTGLPMLTLTDPILYPSNEGSSNLHRNPFRNSFPICTLLLNSKEYGHGYKSHSRQRKMNMIYRISKLLQTMSLGRILLNTALASRDSPSGSLKPALVHGNMMT